MRAPLPITPREFSLRVELTSTRVCAKRRRQPEYQTGYERHAQGKREHAQVRMHIKRHWIVAARNHSQKQLAGPEGEQNTNYAAEQRKNKALRKQLADQASAAGADSQTDADLALPGGRSC